MAKFNPELPTLPMRVVPNGLEHVASWVQELFRDYANGAEVEVKVYQRRSLPHLKKYWVILHLCVANSENKYGSAEDLHNALKIALGYKRVIKVLISDGENETIVLPGSISFANMDQAAFKVYFDKAMEQLRLAGYPIDDYLKEADRELSRNPAYQGGRYGRGQASRSGDCRTQEQGDYAEAA